MVAIVVKRSASGCSVRKWNGLDVGLTRVAMAVISGDPLCLEVVRRVTANPQVRFAFFWLMNS
jgi:hypothetical protein